MAGGGDDKFEDFDELGGEGLEVDDDVLFGFESEEIGFGDVENVEEKA
jgi:hypothetical protein